MIPPNVRHTLDILWLGLALSAVSILGCQEGANQSAANENQKADKKPKKTADVDSDDNDEDDAEDHGPRPEDEADEDSDAKNSVNQTSTDNEQSPLTMPTAPATATTTTPTTGTTPEDNFKAMIAAGKVMTTINIDPTNPELDGTAPATNWFTSTSKPIKIYAAVDASGQVTVPANVNTRQIASGKVGAPTDEKFQANGAAVTTLHSAVRVCNKSGRQIYLHASNQSPFRHGAAGIVDGDCAQFLIERATNTAGATYDHLAGSGSPIIFEVVKIDAQGKVVP